MMAGLVALDVLLFTVAAVRPWVGMTLLLAGLPFNGFLANVVRVQLGLGPLDTVALGAWHDSLAFGVLVAAAGETVRRHVGWHRSQLELLGLGSAVLGLGLIYVCFSPRPLAALYAYRTLYEPIILALAIIRLAATSSVPGWTSDALAWAVVSGGVLAGVYTWYQVYIGGFPYIDTYYRDPGQPLRSAYAAAFVNQPRGIGTFQGPNEFAAYLTIVMVALATPGLLRLPLLGRAVLVGVTTLALLLSFSRSGWLSTAVALMAVFFLSRSRLPSGKEVLALRQVRRTGLGLALVAGVTVCLAAAILLWSGAPQFIVGTISGTERSASGRPINAAEMVERVAAEPLGSGLGTAGPKSARFDAPGFAAPSSSEVWYLNYIAQVGVVGLALLVVFVVGVLKALRRARDNPWARAATASLLGLGIGAIFIPIIDDPSVAIPLWSLVGLGIGLGVRGDRADRP